MQHHGFLLMACAPPLADSTAARWIDLVGLALVALFLMLGILRGLWWQVVRLLGLVASVAVARAVAPRFSPSLAKALPGLGEQAANGATWLFVLLLGLLFVAAVGRAGKATIEAAHLGAFDRVGGAVAGAVSGGLVHVAFLLVACQISSASWKESAVEGTQSQLLLDAVQQRFPALLDARAAESIAPRHREAEEPGSVVR
jgi:uncharacterized membrane protein required for colicin V production